MPVGLSSYTAFHATVVTSGTPPVTVFTRSAANPALLSPAGLVMPGLKTFLVRVVAIKTSGGAPGTAWVGRLTYGTTGHGISTSYKKDIAAPVGAALGDRVQLQFDMSALTAGGTDWLTSTIDQIQLELDNDSPSVWSIESVTFGSPAGYVAPLGAVARLDQLGGDVRNLNMEASSTTVTATFSSATLVNALGEPLSLGSESLSLSTGNPNGLNGLDTGSWAVDTWYAIRAITDGASVGLLASTSYAGPTLPGTYQTTKFLGWVRTAAGSATFVHTLKIKDWTRYVGGASGLPKPVNGVTPGSGAWYAVSLANWIPTTANAVGLTLQSSSFVFFAPNNSFPTSDPWNQVNNSADSFIAPLETTTVYIRATNGGTQANLWVSGWED